MASLGILCQLVYFFAMGSLYQYILITFSLSVILIYAIDFAAKRKKIYYQLLSLATFLAIFFLVVILPTILTGTDFCIDYGIWGVLVPVFAYIGKKQMSAYQFCSHSINSACRITWRNPMVLARSTSPFSFL